VNSRYEYRDLVRDSGHDRSEHSSKRTRHHKERNPGELRRIVQEVSDYRWNQAPQSQEIGETPQHAAKCSGGGDSEPRKESLVQIACEVNSRARIEMSAIFFTNPCSPPS